MTWENRLIFEVSSTDPDAAIPVWVDLTSRINDMLSTVEIGIGRQNDLDQSEPTNWTLVLNNADDALTYGNTSSPYPWWGPGRKCRLREIVAGTVMPLATGYLQVPTETVSLSGIDQTVTVSIVDRLGRLQVSEPFISTLGAYIRADPAALQLIALWPMASGSSTVQNDASVAGTGPLTAQTLIQEASVPGTATFRANAATPILADDLTPGLFTTVPGVVTNTAKTVFFSSTKTLTQTDQVATVAWWQWWDDTNSVAPEPIVVSGSPNILQVFRSVGVWKVFDGTTINPLPNPLPTMKWTFCAVHWTASTIEFWQDTNPPVVFAHAVGALNAKGCQVGVFFGGAMAYVQIYDGPLYTYATHVAQFQAGVSGLERQLTGDRIRTIAQYAGLPNAEFANTIDTGTSVMQVATLAGKTPLEAMREAETTEQGLLYVDGSGNLTFNDRRTLYNI